MDVIVGFITLCVCFTLLAGLYTKINDYREFEIIPTDEEWLMLLALAGWMVSYFYFGGS